MSCHTGPTLKALSASTVCQSNVSLMLKWITIKDSCVQLSVLISEQNWCCCLSNTVIAVDLKSACLIFCALKC